MLSEKQKAKLRKLSSLVGQAYTRANSAPEMSEEREALWAEFNKLEAQFEQAYREETEKARKLLAEAFQRAKG